MSNVIQLGMPKSGDTTFMLCTCNPEQPEPFVAQVIYGEKIIVCALQCPLCDAVVNVVNGILCHE